MPAEPAASSLNLEAQARMIEDLIMKNVRLTEDNTQLWKTDLPFNDVSKVAKNEATFDTKELTQDEPFALFANIKSIQYISEQFNAHKHSREVLLDTKNACF